MGDLLTTNELHSIEGMLLISSQKVTQRSTVSNSNYTELLDDLCTADCSNPKIVTGLDCKVYLLSPETSNIFLQISKFQIPLNYKNMALMTKYSF